MHFPCGNCIISVMTNSTQVSCDKISNLYVAQKNCLPSLDRSTLLLWRLMVILIFRRKFGTNNVTVRTFNIMHENLTALHYRPTVKYYDNCINHAHCYENMTCLSIIHCVNMIIPKFNIFVIYIQVDDID